jgi:hypothetical protein
MEGRLGRKLEPHDLWYELGGAGDLPGGRLDSDIRKRYPTVAAFDADLPQILRAVGFQPPQIKALTAAIVVDPARGAGRPIDTVRRGDKLHLRVRIDGGGMTARDYDLAVRELGHDVAEYFSLYEIDHAALAGVPNAAFTEAFATVFQTRSQALLGRKVASGDADRMRVLDRFWNARELAGAALVEIDVWHWLYDHPDASATDLRDATVRIARATWDHYYAPYLGGRGTTSLLAIYSHTLSQPLFLFSYVLGHVIAFQLDEHLANKDARTFAAELARMARQGAVLPDDWMRHATGAAVSARGLFDATARALRAQK